MFPVLHSRFSFKYSSLNCVRLFVTLDFPHCWQILYCLSHQGGGSDNKEFAYNMGDSVSIPGSGRSPREENGYPLQYSHLENSTDRRPGGPQSMGSQRAGHDWVTNTFRFSLAVHLVYSSVDMSTPISRFIPLRLPYLWCSCVCSLHLCLCFSLQIGLFVPFF